MFILFVIFVEQKFVSLYGKLMLMIEVMYYCILEFLWILKLDCIFRVNIFDVWIKFRNLVKFLIVMYMILFIYNGLGYYL